MLPETMKWENEKFFILDQRALPGKVEYLACSTHHDVAHAIKTLAVRGAPAIGIAAAYGVAIAARCGASPLEEAIDELAATRPTAVNLFWALERMRSVIERTGEKKFCDLINEARIIHSEDIANNRKLGAIGAALLPGEATVLTHCNAGALATGGHGTALGIVRSAREDGKKIKIYADETRPVLQGARLTSWELMMDGFDVTVICDSMAAALMSKTKIDAVIVGADRIAANGDAANKIGTYALAIAAKHHGVPFYVAAPTSTLDTSLPSGDEIPIEERDAEEIRALPGNASIPKEISIWNPAFDVTPAGLITAIVTERALHRPPYDFSALCC